MATVYVVTAGSGDSYRIERVYLDSGQAYGFAQDYNGIAPWIRCRWRNGRPVPRRPPTTARDQTLGKTVSDVDDLVEQTAAVFSRADQAQAVLASSTAH